MPQKKKKNQCIHMIVAKVKWDLSLKWITIETKIKRMIIVHIVLNIIYVCVVKLSLVLLTMKIFMAERFKCF